ncbi:MAG: hypothetical protein QME52_06325 [Bacteroidota bacterium]|nr:hypothetical protein [Bacteroidota bacterium]
MRRANIVTIVVLAFIFNHFVFSQVKFLKSFSIDQLTEEKQQQPPSNSISHIAIYDTTIYIGTGRGLAKSTDGGRSWISYQSNPAFANNGIYAIAVRQDAIWVSTGYMTDVGDGSIQTGSGYTYSHDDGKNWTHVPQPIDTCIEIITASGKKGCRDYHYKSYGINDSVRVTAVTTPIANVTYDISMALGTVWIASWSSSLRKSTNDGKTWEQVLLPLDYQDNLTPETELWYFSATDSMHQDTLFKFFDVVNNNNLKAFSVLALDDGTVWCGTAGGVNRSTDGGVNWTKFNRQNQASPILGNWVIAIREQRFQNIQRIWITNWKATNPDEEFGVSYTEDNGRTWKNLLHGVRAYDFAFKDSIAYIATEEGLYRTPDGGITFQKISNGASEVGGALTVNNSVSIFDPESRQVITSSRFISVGVIGDTVFVGTDDGFARTIDNDEYLFGSSWKIFRTFQEIGISNTTYAYPNPFSPNLELVRIHYSPKSNNQSFVDRNVSIDIFDFGMNRVRTLIQDAKRSTTMEYDELWDGRDDQGKLVANGVYFYMVRINDDGPSYGKILVIQ